MPDLPSPTQNMAQILQDNVFWFFVFFFLNETSSQAPSQTQSQISRGAAQKPEFPKGVCAGKCETRKATPLLARGGDRALPLPFGRSLS